MSALLNLWSLLNLCAVAALAGLMGGQLLRDEIKGYRK